jgi:hypothetical protein
MNITSAQRTLMSVWTHKCSTIFCLSMWKKLMILSMNSILVKNWIKANNLIDHQHYIKTPCGAPQWRQGIDVV